MIDCLFMAPGGHGLADSRLYLQPAQGGGRWLDLPALSAALAGDPLQHLPSPQATVSHRTR